MVAKLGVSMLRLAGNSGVDEEISQPVDTDMGVDEVLNAL